MGKQLARYSKQASEITFNLLDSHDTPRLLTLCQDDKLKMKLAAAIQFTYLGVPCIYYGDEVGLTGEDDPDCRKCMEWDESRQDQQLLQFYKRLIEVRKQSPALKSGSVRFLIAEAGGDILAYERRLDDEVVVVVINNSDMKQTVLLPVDHAKWQDVMNQKKLNNKSNSSSGSGLPIILGAYDFVILNKI
jgi:glycosidase